MTPLQRAFVVDMRRGFAAYHGHRNSHWRNRTSNHRCQKCIKTQRRIFLNALTAQTLFGS